MNPREIVLGTIDYTGTERVAGSMPAPYWNDLCHASCRLQGYSAQWLDVGGGRQEYVDEWGNTWARVDDYSKGEVARGAIEDLDDVFTVPLPDLANPANYEVAAEVYNDPQNDLFRIGGLPGFPFNIARKMRRLDQFLMDLLLDRERVCVLLKRIELALALLPARRDRDDAGRRHRRDARERLAQHRGAELRSEYQYVRHRPAGPWNCGRALSRPVRSDACGTFKVAASYPDAQPEKIAAFRSARSAGAAGLRDGGRRGCRAAVRAGHQRGHRGQPAC